MASVFISNPASLVPPRTFSGVLQTRFEQASLALGRLDAVASTRGDHLALRAAFIKKEGLLSAQLEGGRLATSEAPLTNHQDALDWGLLQIRHGFPLSSRLLRVVYAKLADVPSAPPLPADVTEGMAYLERFLNDVPERTPPLLKAGMAHAFFSALHPFPDDNGRMGRLLIALSLCADGALHEPLLYLSLYLKQHRAEYYELLTQVRETGDWEAWLDFFAKGVVDTATNAVRTTEELVALFATDRERVLAAGRPTKSTLAVFDALRERPINNAPRLAAQTGLTLPTVITALERLQTLGIADEITGKRRNRTYRYSAYILRLSEGTEPLSPT